VSRSQFWEYHDRVEEPLCPTLLSLLDRHTAALASRVGLDVDPARPFRYYKFRDLADLLGTVPDCSEGGGCAQGNGVYSIRFFHAHEQAHEYVFRAWGGWSTGLLVEGEAVALSCDPFASFKPDERPADVLGWSDWRDLLDVYGDTRSGYTATGVFVTYLAQKYGWSSVAELHRRIPPGTSVADFEDQFAQVYPTSMDQAWREALGVAGAPSCERNWMCMTTAMTPGDEAAPDCDDELHRSVTVTDQGGVVLTLEGQDHELMLFSCTAATPVPFTLEGGRGTPRATHWAALPPGSYTLLRGAQSPLPTRVAFSAYLPAPLVGDTCDSAGTVSLDPAGTSYIDLLPGRVNGWIHVAGGGRRYDVFPQDLGGSDSAALVLCDDCDSASCLPLPYGQLTSVVIGDRSRVRMQDVFALPAPQAAWGRLVFLSAPSSKAGP
jgi:hypothetical protein